MSVGLIISLVLAGMAGLNFLVILCAVLFCMCNRSRKAFDMRIWDYFVEKKKREKNGRWRKWLLQ